ncbi:MAG: nitroreductase family protein [Dehalococcoidia bacterium]|nr:nitroreductase family protein [Dehalococcoidia bacterium]
MTYEDFLELVKKRRSIRRFKPDPLPDDYVEKIIEAARWSPSGANSQPWEFVVVKDRDTKEKIGEWFQEAAELSSRVENTRDSEMRHSSANSNVARPGFIDAPVLILLCGDLRTREVYPLASMLTRADKIFYSSLASAFLYMHLAATTLGLASRWVSSTANTLPQARIKNLLGIPKEFEIYDTMALGYPASAPRPRFVRERQGMVHREKFDKSIYRNAQQLREFIIKVHNPNAPAGK